MGTSSWVVAIFVWVYLLLLVAGPFVRNWADDRDRRKLIAKQLQLEALERNYQKKISP